MIVHCDFETRGSVELKEVGLDNYARHRDTSPWCLSWAIDDREPSIWHPQIDTPSTLFAALWEGSLVVAHNAAFEMAIWEHIMVPRYGWPPLKTSQGRCTMAMAYAMSLPGSLEKAAAAVGIERQKDMAGHRLMLQMAKPKTVTPLTWWDDEDKTQQLYDYCKQDVRVEQQLWARLLPLSDSEQRLWVVDRAINSRGVYVDRPAITAALSIVGQEQQRLAAELRVVTEGVVGGPTEVAGLTRWVQAQGVTCDSLAKADLSALLMGETLTPRVRRALEIRQEAAKTSTAKLTTMLDAVGADGRIRDTLQYHAAGTGRWGGRRIQPQNLPRSTMKQGEIDQVFELFEDGEATAGYLDLFYGPPLSVVSNCLRGMICAPPGKSLVAGDYANIEGRVLAWLAGEEWKLQAFRDFDAKTGPDLYLLAASRIYRQPIETYTKASPERQIGKTAELACGFGGGIGAFQTMARAFGLTISDAEADMIKVAWRDAHPRIVQYWYDLETAASDAVAHPGTKTYAGAAGRRVCFRVKGSFLFCLLPSGRMLTYPYPKLKDKLTPWGDLKEQVHYMHVDSLTNKWVETSTYGGKLSENITQAVSRDVLAEAILRVELVGYPVVMHVHDEIVAEVSEASGALPEFLRHMGATPPWAAGLPIAVEGWQGRRYKK